MATLVSTNFTLHYGTLIHSPLSVLANAIKLEMDVLGPDLAGSQPHTANWLYLILNNT